MVSHDVLMQAPEYLDGEAYPLVGHFILSDFPSWGPDSASRLAVDGAMDRFTVPKAHETVSLKRQLNEVNNAAWMKNDIEGIAELGVPLGPTEGYVAATAGAIPLLAVVKGFHQANGTPAPTMAGPDTHSKAWCDLAARDHVSVLLHHAENNHKAARNMIENLLDNGILHITVLQGRCYEKVYMHDIDTATATSRHDEMMQRYGRLCVWG